MSGNWKEEHPDAEVPEAIYNHKNLKDVSWVNDGCPSFEILNDKGIKTGYHIWVDYKNLQYKEDEHSPRFEICGYHTHSYITDDLTAALKHIEEKVKEHNIMKIETKFDIDETVMFMDNRCENF